MNRQALKLITPFRRSALKTLEAAGLHMEMGDCGGYRASGSLDEFPSSGDSVEDEKLRNYIISKQFDAERSRERRLRRMRKLARMDLRMIGGVTPIGFFGGAGGGDTTFRAASTTPRS